MITLSEAQRDAINAMGGQPVPVVDDQTNRRYYLIRAENLEKLLAGQTTSPVGSPGDADEQTGCAMAIRATWMREMGLSEEEVDECCQADALAASVEEEQLSLEALRRVQRRRQG